MNITELRELLNKATPSPWDEQHIFDGENMIQHWGMAADKITHIGVTYSGQDAALIVALVNNASALLDEVDAWRQVWTALNEMGANLGDANKPLSVAASWALKHYEIERLRDLKQQLQKCPICAGSGATP